MFVIEECNKSLGSLLRSHCKQFFFDKTNLESPLSVSVWNKKVTKRKMIV